MATPRRSAPPAVIESLLEAVADVAKRERRSVRAVVETALEQYVAATPPAKRNGKQKSVPGREVHAGRALGEALERAAQGSGVSP